MFSQIISQQLDLLIKIQTKKQYLKCCSAAVVGDVHCYMYCLWNVLQFFSNCLELDKHQYKIELLSKKCDVLYD